MPRRSRWLLLSVVSLAAPRGLDEWEPDPEAYFAQGVLEFEPSSLSRSEFDAHVRAGRPLVVRGAGHGHPMESWTCDFFRQSDVFRDVEVRREYDHGAPASGKWVRMKDIGTSTPKTDGKRSIAPYYFGIKDAARPPEELAGDPDVSATWSRRVLLEVQAATAAFHFMDPRNRAEMQTSPEFWISTATGSAKAHVDSHTESTMTLQLSGRKRWRLSLIGRRQHPHVMKLYADGQVYGRPENVSWQLLENVTLEPGDALFFGPGFIHETLNLYTQDVPGLDTCAASITHQFDVPRATGLYRNFLTRFRFTPDAHESWPHIARWARSAERALAAAPGAEFLEERLRRNDATGDLAAFLDADGDGRVSAGEAAAVAAAWARAEARVRRAVPRGLQERGFGTARVAESDEFHAYPPALRREIAAFEARAFAADAAAGAAEPWALEEEL